MLWCLKRKKKQVRSEKPDPVQVSDVKKDPSVLPAQVFPDGYKTMVLNLWSSMVVGANLMGKQKKGHIAWYIKKLREGKARYISVSVELAKHGFDIPWEVIGVLHGLEASFDFNKQILNGQSIKKKTTWVPKGHGPWDTWEDSCLSGFIVETPYNPPPRKWTVTGTALFLERWNGMGYWRKSNHPSPYLWSYSSAQKRGKYVSDGRFSSLAVSLQVGGMTMLKQVGFFS